MNFSKIKSDPRLPKHVGLIIDGNGRWAKARGLPRTAGHKVGADNIRKHINCIYDLGIKNLSIFAFSCENWNRPKKEVDYLMELFEETFDNYLNEYADKDARFIFSGDLEDVRIPLSLRKKAKDLVEKTKTKDGMTINICINYGGRQDILRAINTLISNGKTEVELKDIDNNLYTKDLYPLDVVIRTSKEYRLSNFMLWQISYTELIFAKKNWPAFTTNDLLKCMKIYMKRERRYGGIKE